MQETYKTRVQSLHWEESMEEGIATHPYILAWRIPWTEEFGRLQPVDSQRVRHNRNDIHDIFSLSHVIWRIFFLPKFMSRIWLCASFLFTALSWCGLHHRQDILCLKRGGSLRQGGSLQSSPRANYKRLMRYISHSDFHFLICKHHIVYLP